MTSIIKRLFLIVGLAGIATALYATPAAAQASRTWVSGVGDDVNPCSRTAPCKTFAGAIPKTAAGGEINCLDPGGWGAVTITKAMTIDCSQFPGGIQNAGGNGITVNAGGNDIVTIRGLELNAASIASPGVNGIRFLAGGGLIVEDVVIRGNNLANGEGILFAPSGPSQLHVIHTTISNNGSGSTGGGILIQPTGTGSAKVSLVDTRIVDNANGGLVVNSTGNTGPGITVAIDDSTFAGNSTGIALSAPASTTTIGVMINHATITGNTTGIVAFGATLTGRVANSTITGNATGLLVVPGATFLSYGNNRLDGNPTVGAPNDGAFTGAAPSH